MEERNVERANELHNTKRDLRFALGMCEGEKMIDIHVSKLCVPVRASFLEELLHKEVEHVDRMLNMLGVNDLT